MIPKPKKSVEIDDLKVTGDMSMYDRFPRFDQKFCYTGVSSSYYPGFPGQDKDDTCGEDFLCIFGLRVMRPETELALWKLRQKSYGLG